ncbi:MAG: acyl-CoA dehydratase activase [Fusobacteria bacterium]|nr:acyl-CoA dehydratase activase [Fusobacteriota bacterium]
MIQCMCKYAPFAIFDGFDEVGEILDSDISSFSHSERLLPPNLCAYTKVVMESIVQKGVKKLFLVNCCDSIKRLYDTLLLDKCGLEMVYMMELPRKVSCCSSALFATEIMKFITYYEEQFGVKFSLEKFNHSLYKYLGKAVPEQEYIAVLGAKASKDFLFKVSENLSLPIDNQTCSRAHFLTRIEHFETVQKAIEWYAGEILAYTPCMRMIDISMRKSLINSPNLKGVIYHTVKFCDHYGYEYAELANKGLPILKVESDLTLQSSGQMMTRIEAFQEQLGRKRGTNMKSDKLYVVGMDSGSTSTNVVIINRNREIVSSSIVPTGAKSSKSAELALELALKEANIVRDDIALIVGTGYGRYTIDVVEENITEISCHAKGAHFLNPLVRTVIDIGGQDSKVISLDESGSVKGFVMNDKCAAGTGRFLEMIARSLEISLETMATEGLNWHEDLTITSVCSVFAESEVVSLIANNKERSDIIHGVNKSIASKTVSLVERVGKNGVFMMTGGVAKNSGVLAEISRCLGSEVYVSSEPQICGALGAALLGLERIEK